MSSPDCFERELRQRIDVGRVNPMGAAIVGYAESLGIGNAASADLIRGLEHDKLFACGRKPPPGGDAGGTRPHDDGIDPAGARHLGCRRGARRCKRGRGRQDRGGGGEEGSTAQTSHGAQGVKRCEVYHGTRVPRVGNLVSSSHACGIATAMPYSRPAPNGAGTKAGRQR